MNAIVTVDFHGDAICAVEQGDNVFVALKPVVEAMGLDWSAQYRRTARDPILSKGIAMMAIPFGGGAQDATCLRLDLVNGWLFTIDSGRIKNDAVREKVLLYQRECYRVLFEHFHPAPKAIEAIAKPATTGPLDAIQVKLQLVREARRVFGETAAREMWFAAELPIVPAMEKNDPRIIALFTQYNGSKDPAERERLSVEYRRIKEDYAKPAV